MSEEATKSEAVVFFNLSEDKATISKANALWDQSRKLDPTRFLLKSETDEIVIKMQPNSGKSKVALD